jgi:hypothetical protein
MSNELLGIVRLAQHQGWEFLLTLDESWFHLSISHKIIWLRESEPFLEKKKHMIQAKKRMATIAWNPHGFHVVYALPKKENFKATYYIEHIMRPILEYRLKSGLHQFIVHVDNARPQTARKSRIFCESNPFRIAPHSPYLPDLAPSDFFFSDMLSIA